MKPYKQRSKDSNYLHKIELFKKDSDRMFDIAACKCKELAPVKRFVKFQSMKEYSLSINEMKEK